MTRKFSGCVQRTHYLRKGWFARFNTSEPTSILHNAMPRAASTPRGNRNYVFTIFDLGWSPVEDEIGAGDHPIRYLVYQREKCPETGRKHLQGYVEFNKQMRLAAAKTALHAPDAHLEPRMGTRDEARKYCMKEETRDGPDAGPHEHGEFRHSKDASESSYAACRDLLASGAKMSAVLDQMPGMFMRHHSSLQKARFLYMQSDAKKWRDVKVIVYCGSTGLGKSRRAHYEYPNAYSLNFGRSDDNWFDGYDGEEALIIDDFAGKHQLHFRFLLQVLDGHPCRLPIKGGHTWALWTTVVITTNIEPCNWYQDELWSGGPLQRRIRSIIHFSKRTHIPSHSRRTQRHLHQPFRIPNTSNVVGRPVTEINLIVRS